MRDGDFSDKDVDTFSAEWVRKVRSTVSITVAMWGGVGCRIGEHPLVTSFVQSLTNDDLLNRGRRKYRYDDTWDVEALFASLAAALRRRGRLRNGAASGTPRHST